MRQPRQWHKTLTVVRTVCTPQQVLYAEFGVCVQRAQVLCHGVTSDLTRRCQNSRLRQNSWKILHQRLYEVGRESEWQGTVACEGGDSPRKYYRRQSIVYFVSLLSPRVSTTSAAQFKTFQIYDWQHPPQRLPPSYRRRRHRYHLSRPLFGPGASTSHGLLPQRRPRLLPRQLTPEAPASEGQRMHAQTEGELQCSGENLKSCGFPVSHHRNSSYRARGNCSWLG